MSRLEKGIRNELASHLNNLEDIDYEDDDTPDLLGEDLLLGKALNEDKMRLYRTPEFKQFLRDFLENKHKIKKEKVSNKYSEKVYRSMYSKIVLPNRAMNLYTKVFYHPDVTETDYNYIKNKTNNFKKYVIYNQIGCFLLVGLLFYKTSFGNTVRNNPLFGAITLGVVPFVTLIGTEKMNMYLLDRRLRMMGLPAKYGIQK